MFDSRRESNSRPYVSQALFHHLATRDVNLLVLRLGKTRRNTQLQFLGVIPVVWEVVL